MRVVTIIGGGIAGTVLGGALARADIPVTVVEQQSGNSSGGAFLFIDERGHAALRELGVDDDAVAAASFPVNALEYADSAGRRSAMSRGHRFWLRSALMGVLEDFLGGSGARLRYDTRITEVGVDAAGSCRIRHSDGSVRTIEDVLIGADGIDSVVRAGLEPARTAVYAGDVVLYGMTSGPVEVTTVPQILHFFAELDAAGAAASTFGHLWRPGQPAHWFLRIAREPLDGPDDLGLRPMDEWSATVLAATPSITELVRPLLERTEAVHVSNARNVPLDDAADSGLPVVLIGDADHAITPAAGVGARDALEDAHAVYRALTTGASPAEAMALRRKTIIEDRRLAMRRRASVSR